MKNFSFIVSALILAISSHMAAASEEKPHLSAVGPERELGLVLENCKTYCNYAKTSYQVCYYPLLSKPQQICWEKSLIRNLRANALRLLTRLECGACPDSVEN